MSASCEIDPAEGYALWAANYPPHAHNPLMLVEERAMLSLVPEALQGTRVLDVGCGSGRYLLHARGRGATVLGVDPSIEMLAVACSQDLPVIQGSVDDLPVLSGCADLVLCGLTLGHVANLRPAMAELARVLADGGSLICSDFHPIAAALGWERTFKVENRRYAVRYTTHHYCDWHTAARSAGLCIEEVLEPRLDPKDIVDGQRFDPRALELPVAIVFRLRKAS
jgi:malonyl-CoA O-methyltransferase